MSVRTLPVCPDLASLIAGFKFGRDSTRGNHSFLDHHASARRCGARPAVRSSKGALGRIEMARAFSPRFALTKPHGDLLQS